MKTRSISALNVLALVLAAASCGAALAYRDVQDDFETAVLTDGRGLDPREVIEFLDDARIARLTRHLQPNAWMLRSYAEWRSRALADAKRSAERGVQAGPVSGSRDDVLLHLVPALLIDTEVMDTWQAGPKAPTLASYRAGPARDMATARAKLADAEQRFGPATPATTKHYVAYQRWRILQNWREILSHLPSAAARNAAREEARQDGRSLREAADAARDAIPSGSPLHDRIASQGG